MPGRWQRTGLVKTANSRFGSLFPGMLPLFVVAHFAQHVVTALLVPLLPMIRSEFALDYTKSGLVVSAFNLSYGASQVPAGWLNYRVGSFLMIAISIGGVALAGILVGLSQTYLMLIIFLILMGILGGGYHPASSTAISETVEPKKWGQALGLHMVGGSASFFMAPLVAAGIASVWGWRMAYISVAVPTLVFGILFYYLLRRQTAGRAGLEAAGGHTGGDGAAGHPRRLVLLICLTAFTQAVSAATRSFIPLFMVDHFGVSGTTAAASISLVYTAGFWAGPLGGYLSDRWGRVPLILAVGFILSLLIYLLTVVPYGVGFGALLVAMGATVYIYSPVLQAYIVEHTSARNRALVLGTYFFGSSEVGGILTPVMGYLIDQFGFSTSFTIAAATAFTPAVIGFLFLRSVRD